ncbi:MAG: thiamine diphosphokinase [Tindallia sp. MSAO_Bac2]|nr:MAG: thiamine diphosphokinase [Tindallia sp. MSAO_Bac2]
MKILIITNGDISDLFFLQEKIKDHDYLICVDGAARYLRKIQQKPDLMVGDMDSVSDEDLSWIESFKIPVKRYKTRKDYTDTEIAIDAALDHNARFITILGAVGNRLDHSLSNIFLLKKIDDAGIEGLIADKSFELQYLNKDKQLDWKRGEVVSFIPIDQEEAILSLDGFEYPLENKAVSRGTSLCVSNVVARDCPSVIINNGSILAVRNKKVP